MDQCPHICWIDRVRTACVHFRGHGGRHFVSVDGIGFEWVNQLGETLDALGLWDRNARL